MLGKKLIKAAAGNAGGNPNAWDLSYAEYDVGADAFNISKIYNSSGFQTIDVTTNTNVIQGMKFNNDGTKLFTIGGNGDDIDEYALSIPFKLTSFSYTGRHNFSTSNSIENPKDVFFNADGTQMFILANPAGNQQGDSVYRFNLSTAFTVTSGVTLSQTKAVSTQSTSTTALWFKSDGTKMYVLGDDKVFEYSLSTAWSVTTASYTQQFSVSTQETNSTGLSFNNDGTEMFIVGVTNDSIFKYTLSTAWDVSTASYASVSYSVAGRYADPRQMCFEPDGSAVYVTGLLVSGSDIVGWNIGGFYVASQDSVPTDLFFKPDGTKMYVLGDSGNRLYEYSLSTAWDVSTASYVQLFSITQEGNPEGVFFREDGLKMYVVGRQYDTVFQYSLSTAWDISTLSYDSISFSVTAQEANPRAIFFKSDGLKMYVLGQSGQDVNQYSLSTAWNVSTASYVQSFSVAAQEPVPVGMFFKSDGTKMYVGGTTQGLYEYALATAWDVSTASYTSNFIYTRESTPQGVFWNPDGTQFFIVGNNLATVLPFKIPEPV